MFFVYQNLQACEDALAIINSKLPVVGLNKGIPAPTKQQTTKWADPRLMSSGEYCFPIVPPERLQACGELFQNKEGEWEYSGIPSEVIKDFLTNHGTDIRELTSTDFPEDEPPE